MSDTADPLDQASLLTEQLTKAYLDNTRAKARPEQIQRADGSWPSLTCVDCEDELGGRLALGKIRCISCQSAKERERRFAR